MAARHGVPADRQVKTLVYVLDDRLTLVLMRGDHSLVEQKLLDTTAARTLRPAQPDEIRDALGASPGSLGAVGVAHLPVIADEALRGRRAMTTGANKDGVHLRGVDVGRDLAVGQWADLREVAAGEPCVVCGAALEVVRTVEVGHIFQLGTKYTEALGVTVLGPDGSRVTPVMGCYGIGVERAMAAIVEAHHDDAGIVWPVAVAPFEVAIVPIGGANEAVASVVGSLYDGLRAQRVDVVLDDRDERPGVKFRDIELVGIPYRITVGPRGLAEGRVEVTVRETGESTSVPVDEAVAYVRGLVAEAAVL
ncbi:proline--tRNA ligase [Yinghuangia aomiensis]